MMVTTGPLVLRVSAWYSSGGSTRIGTPAMASRWSGGTWRSSDVRMASLSAGLPCRVAGGLPSSMGPRAAGTSGTSPSTGRRPLA